MRSVFNENMSHSLFNKKRKAQDEQLQNLAMDKRTTPRRDFNIIINSG